MVGAGFASLETVLVHLEPIFTGLTGLSISTGGTPSGALLTSVAVLVSEETLGTGSNTAGLSGLNEELGGLLVTASTLVGGTGGTSF